MAWTAARWRGFYADERARLGDSRLAEIVGRAPDVDLPESGALVFPHARLEGCGHLVAAVARAVVRSRCDRVLALGVLHGGRERDAEVVAAARGGDGQARDVVRRVHGPGAPHDRGLADEEFSLDNFEVLLDIAARVEGHRPPVLVKRFSFLVGHDVAGLPGLEELRALVASGVAVVATGDLVHHGVGYDTPLDLQLDQKDAQTIATARRWIEQGLAALCRHDLDVFFQSAAVVRSDFRDVGPVLAALLAPRGEQLHARVLDLELVSYADVFDVPEPTWVAAALCAIELAVLE